MNNTIFRKSMKNVRNHRGIKLVTTKAKMNYLLSAQSYQTTKNLLDNFLAREMKRAHIFMNKSIFSSLLILEISKIIMCQF